MSRCASSAGSRTALIGPNGAGKTTLVGLLSGTIRPDAGRISLHGRDITRDALAFRVKQGLVRTFQVSSLFAKLTVLENIFLAVSENAGASRRPLAPGGTAARPDRTGRRNSGAPSFDRQAGTVASAKFPTARSACWKSPSRLALKPKVLLLDEPAAGIPATRSACCSTP